MKRLLSTLLLLAALLPVRAEEPTQRFTTAQRAYDEGRYADALAFYNTLHAEGWRAPELYFNRGNALARLGRTGEAVASFQQALLLAPRNADAEANLRFVTTGAGVPAPKRSLASHLFGALTPVEWTTLAAAAWWIGLLLATTAFALPTRPRSLLRGAAIAGVLLVASLSGRAWWWNEARAPAAVVVQSGAKALFAPVSSATPHFETPEGLTVRAVERNGDWLRVRHDGREGWLPRTAVQIVELAAAPTLR
ncbi:MAG TPA: tetratricopeptide repeat protein [Kiritimatiellia bacterium]|nr:tetratricopeptide repeat protein [Kiritimatiellia bacterium]